MPHISPFINAVTMASAGCIFPVSTAPHRPSVRYLIDTCVDTSSSSAPPECLDDTPGLQPRTGQLRHHLNQIVIGDDTKPRTGRAKLRRLAPHLA